MFIIGILLLIIAVTLIGIDSNLGECRRLLESIRRRMQ